MPTGIPKPSKPFRPMGATGPNMKVGGGVTGKINAPSAAKQSAVKAAKPLSKTVKKAVVSKAKPPRPGTGSTYR